MLKILGLGISILTFTTLSSLAGAAESGATGRWQGWGLWTYGENSDGTNCNMTIGFSESPTEFRRLGGVFDCNVVALYSDPLKWQRTGDDLQLDGKPAGKIQTKHVDVLEPVNDQTQAETLIDLEDTPQGQRLHYKEIWFTLDAKGNRKTVYLIRGEFKRAR